MHDFFHQLLEFWLPLRCLVCDMPSHSKLPICLGCLNELPYLNHGCKLCACPLENTRAEFCGSCLTKPPMIEQTIALFHYRPPITQFITRLKFGGQLIYAKLLGQLLAQRLQDHYQNQPRPECIIPIPLHYKRLRERGFNQSLLLGKIIAKELAIPIEQQAYIRHRYTEPQAQLAAKQRHSNIRLAFSQIKSINYTHVAVLDDVITTGHTVREFCELLRKTGVKRIEVWGCAKA